MWVEEDGDKLPSHMASFPRVALLQPEIPAPIFLHSRPQTDQFSTLSCGTRVGGPLPLCVPACKAVWHQTPKPKLHQPPCPSAELTHGNLMFFQMDGATERFSCSQFS